MGRMKVLASIALCLAACVPAQAAEPLAPRPSAGLQMPPARAFQGVPQQGPQQGLRPAQASPLQEAAKPSSWADARPEPKPAAAMAVLITDDHDSTRLPVFATRTTPLPTRFVRLGVEWSF
jgi:hypothetical protein